MGRADQAQWEALDALLREYGVILQSEDAAGAFDGSIVDSLYDAQGRLR